MDIKRLFTLITLGIFALSGPGCGRAEKHVLVRIDDKPAITLEGFNDRISKLPARYQELINKNKAQFVDELIVDKLLYKEALSRNLEKDREVQDVIEEARRKIVIARLLKDEIEDKVTVTDEDIADYYNANTEKFTLPEVLRASHILVKSEKEASDILVELSNGRNFEDLAKSRSIDPTAKIGGDIGYFTRRQLVPEFEEVCFSMKPGEVSGVVKTKFGYHVIKLTEKKEPRTKELAEVRDEVEEVIKRLKKKMLFSDFVARLKEKSKITVNDKLLASLSEESTPPEEIREPKEEQKE